MIVYGGQVYILVTETLSVIQRLKAYGAFCQVMYTFFSREDDETFRGFYYRHSEFILNAVKNIMKTSEQPSVLSTWAVLNIDSFRRKYRRRIAKQKNK